LHHSFVEQHLLGITREQIGSWLMRNWDMPEELVIALRFQHDPHYAGEHHKYANLVCLAVRLLRKEGIGSGPMEAIPDELLERLKLSREKAQDVVKKVLEAEVLLRELAAQFS
jgi:HD-like signal output (HDOD) protein